MQSPLMMCSRLRMLLGTQKQGRRGVQSSQIGSMGKNAAIWTVSSAKWYKDAVVRLTSRGSGVKMLQSRPHAQVTQVAGLHGTVEPTPERGVIKFLSYNVWCREDLEMHQRMEAVGDLIQEHSPDIICFQEVTPNIYEIFQKSNWWRGYTCSVSNYLTIEGSDFCMQMSKLAVRKFRSKPFGYSIMGRGLSWADVDVGMGKMLVVATSHLESPCPGPPRWDQMYSEERVAQAKESISLLSASPNVIFCGDMNWEEKLDGVFPMPEGWIDAWVELRPGEDGWTYDTKSNQMLSGNRKLQKRLDRFVCKLKDFKVSSIQMIGMEVIPGLSYCKEKKVRNEYHKLMLPVLPSDHYGLLLTISSK